MSAQQVPILHRLDPAAIEQLRARGQYFWADLTLGGVTAAEIASGLGLSEAAVNGLMGFPAEGSPARKIHVEGELIVFPFWCTDPPRGAAQQGSVKLALFRVNVLVHGSFLLTMHEGRIDLPELVAEGGIRAGRSERYVVYVVLDGMINALLETLATIEGDIANIETQLLEAGLRRRRQDEVLIRSLRSDLTTLRLGVGPQRGLFERVSEEIEHVSGLEADPHQYFERILSQIDRAVDRIDAASEALSNALQVKLNETTYRLTVVATVFLPLTFIVGFFGMNFGWMVGEIESSSAFWLLGVGSQVVLLLALVVLLMPGRSADGVRGSGSG